MRDVQLIPHTHTRLPHCPCSAKQFREGLNHMNPTLDAGLAMIIKQRPKAGAIERMDLVGSVDGAFFARPFAASQPHCRDVSLPHVIACPH